MYVCPDCFEDEELKGFVENAAAHDECSFCGNRSKNAIAAPLEDVADHIFYYLKIKYTDPADSGLMYVSAEGGYQGIVWSTEEVLRDEIALELPLDRDGHLLEELARAIDKLPGSPEAWADKDPYGLPEQELLRISWESFARFVMHHRRFFFRKADLPKRDRDYEDPDRLSADELLQRIALYAQDVGLIERMEAGTKLYRARFQRVGATHDTGETLGPPPPESAKQNRMSPAGIPMLHGAEDPDTAVAEVHQNPGDYTVGEFVTTRDAWILDLHELPEVPSFFSERYEWVGQAIIFLRKFAKEVSKPIMRDGKEHISYVPTQVLTEYFRTQVTIADEPLVGVSFTSSRTGRRNYTIFVTKEEMTPRRDGEDARLEPLLRFSGATVVHRTEAAPPTE